jgi:uncharacterized protein YkwD
MMCIKRKTLVLILCMISLSLGACGSSGESDPTSVAWSVQATLTALAPGPAITLIPIDVSPEAAATATAEPVPTLAPTATAPEVPAADTPEPTPTRVPTQTPTAVPPTDVPTPTASLVPQGDLPPSDLTKEEGLVELINQHRSANGVPPLGVATELTAAARRHSQDMAAHNVTAHTGSDGSNGGQRITDAGYNWFTWDEMIGWGFADAASMFDWWANDSVHGPMLLATDVAEIGVGYVWDPNSEWGHYWTVDFASRN